MVQKGTTIGYGDVTPTTDAGKVAVAVYAVLIVNVMAAVLEPGRRYLERMCSVRTGTAKEKEAALDRKRLALKQD